MITQKQKIQLSVRKKKKSETKMKVLKITLAIALMLVFACTPTYAKTQKKDDNAYRLEYLNLKWWERYNDEYLISYLEQAYSNNQDLKISAIKTQQAQEIVKQSFSSQLPQVNFYGDFVRESQSSDVRFGDILIPNYKQSQFVLPLTMKYEVDIWGENYLKTKSAKKQVEMVKQDEKSTYIALSSAIASGYYNLIKTDKLLENQKKLVDLQKEVVAMTDIKYKNGLCALPEYLAQKQLLTLYQESYELYKNRQETLERQIITLVGDRNLSEIKRKNYDEIKMIAVPKDISAAAIQFRPDLAKVENYIQKIGIDVKAARRDFLPKIVLYGQTGFNAYSLDNIFGHNTFKLLGGIAPSFDLFTGGLKMSRLRFTKLEYQKAQQLYEKTIISSIQEINDSLCLAHTDKKNYDSSLERFNLEKDKYKLMEQKNQIGSLSNLNLLKAEEELLLSERDNASDKINYIISTINLYKSVGGKDFTEEI